MLNRRQFLTQTSLFSSAAFLGIGTHTWVARSLERDRDRPQRLIVIFLRGAVDGLNVVIPYRETDYYTNRPKIAIPQPGKTGGAIDLDGTFALHPALDSIFPLWQQKTLAFVHSCGSPNSTRSHFDAQDYMETGTPGSRATVDGWLNRLLALMSDRNPLQAVNVGSTTPRILTGKMPVASIPGGKNGSKKMPIDRPQVQTAFDRLYAGDNSLGRTYREGRIAREELLKDLALEMQMANNGAPLPNGLVRDAQNLGRLMRRDPRVQVGFIGVGGWDTHINQGASQGQLARRLGQLGKGLVTLQQSLGEVYQQTTIVVMSEFGRTVKENGNGGTDHGHGNVMWLLGGALRGGKVYGNWRGLAPSQLYQGRDLAVTTDFRDVLGTVLTQNLGVSTSNLQRIFPNHQYSPSIVDS
jgi:uncharacterized protein (DUF1501 family)